MGRERGKAEQNKRERDGEKDPNSILNSNVCDLFLVVYQRHFISPSLSISLSSASPLQRFPGSATSFFRRRFSVGS